MDAGICHRGEHRIETKDVVAGAVAPGDPEMT